ncbi:MAG: hypothetical protein AAF678_13360 [Pseudomonadota bacterium]
MNANQILNMVVRMLVRRVVRGGVNMGIDAASKQMSKGKPDTSANANPDLAREQKKQQADTSKRMKQSMRTMRRFGRF